MEKQQNGNGSGKQQQTTRRASQNAIPEFSMGPQTIEELISLGEETARTMNSQSISLGLQFAARDLQNQWLESLPEEKNKREGLYWTARGLSSFISTMNGFIQQAQVAISQQTERQRVDGQAYDAGIPSHEM